VRTNIEKLTDDVAGRGGQIVNDPIKLRIYSNDTPDLTIIDFEGVQTFSPEQVEWFKAGSALNIVRAKVASGN
jgi:hypothetical protein